MYRRHVLTLKALVFIATLFSYYLRFNYCSLAPHALTLVSIVVAVYIAAPSALLGSRYAQELKALRDTEDPTRSLLGVLSEYLKWACRFGLLTIIISSYYIVRTVTFSGITAGSLCIEYILSALSCGIFCANIFFLWLISKFLIVSLSNAVVMDNKRGKPKGESGKK